MSVMPVFRGRKGMLFLHMENEKKKKKKDKKYNGGGYTK